MQAIPTLIVDDSKMIVKIIKKALLTSKNKDLYFEESSIYTASDGMEAFDIMGKGHPIKLIISDINMPNLNGDEFIEILKDTGKLDSLDVVFITSKSTKPHFLFKKNEYILGVIYKPFKVDSFIGLLADIIEENKNKLIELQHIKVEQIEQKALIQKASIKYIDKFIDEKKDLIQFSLIDTFIDEIFGDEIIEETQEFPEIIHSIISNYLFEVEINHIINNKNILCVLNSFKEEIKLDTNRLHLIKTFHEKQHYVNSNELKLQEILISLTNPINEVISLTFAKVKKFPKLKAKLYVPYFNYLINKFIEVDCLFMDITLKKLVIELHELQEFSKLIYRYLNVVELTSEIPILLKSNTLKNEIIKRFTKIHQNSMLIMNHYSGRIENLIWEKAKDSLEILNYLKTEIPKTILNTQRFLSHKKKIKREELELYLAYEKQNVVVFSNEIEVLQEFKTIIDPPFNKWDFLCYSRTSFLDVWIKSNTPDKIIIDYDFSTNLFKNGIEFLKFLVKQYPIFQKVINNKQVFIIANNNQIAEIYEYKIKYKPFIINKPLQYKNIENALLYS